MLQSNLIVNPIGLTHYHKVSDTLWGIVQEHLQSLLSLYVQGHRQLSLNVSAQLAQDIYSFLVEMDTPYRTPNARSAQSPVNPQRN